MPAGEHFFKFSSPPRGLTLAHGPWPSSAYKPAGVPSRLPASLSTVLVCPSAASAVSSRLCSHRHHCAGESPAPSAPTHARPARTRASPIARTPARRSPARGGHGDPGTTMGSSGEAAKYAGGPCEPRTVGGAGPRPGGPGPADRACGWGGDRDVTVVARACVRVVVCGHWLWRRVRGALSRVVRGGRVRAGAGIVSLDVELMLRFCLSAFLRCLGRRGSAGPRVC